MENVKAALSLNKDYIMNSAVRNFQSTRSKVAKAINDAVSAAIEEAVEEQEQYKIIKRNFCICFYHVFFFCY